MSIITKSGKEYVGCNKDNLWSMVSSVFCDDSDVSIVSWSSSSCSTISIPVEREWGGILLSTNSIHREGRCWLSAGVMEKEIVGLFRVSSSGVLTFYTSVV